MSRGIGPEVRFGRRELVTVYEGERRAGGEGTIFRVTGTFGILRVRFYADGADFLRAGGDVLADPLGADPILTRAVADLAGGWESGEGIAPVTFHRILAADRYGITLAFLFPDWRFWRWARPFLRFLRFVLHLTLDPRGDSCTCFHREETVG